MLKCFTTPHIYIWKFFTEMLTRKENKKWRFKKAPSSFIISSFRIHLLTWGVFWKTRRLTGIRLCCEELHQTRKMNKIAYTASIMKLSKNHPFYPSVCVYRFSINTSSQKFNLQLENHFIRSNSQQNRFDFILNYGTMQTFIIFQKLNTEDIQDDKNWQKKTTTINNTNYQNLWKTRAIKKRQWELTSLLRVAVAVWRSAGSNARRVSMRGSDDSGKSLNVSLMHLL